MKINTVKRPKVMTLGLFVGTTGLFLFDNATWVSYNLISDIYVAKEGAKRWQIKVIKQN